VVDDLAPLTGPALLRGWVAPSRVVFGPIETNLGAGRALSDRHTPSTPAGPPAVPV